MMCCHCIDDDDDDDDDDDAGEVKTLLRQLLRGVQHLHDNWIIHRDLKASNLLLSHKGILKVSEIVI